MKILFFIIMIIFCIFLFGFYFYKKDKNFKKNLKIGDKLHFWINNEKYTGIVFLFMTIKLVLKLLLME